MSEAVDAAYRHHAKKAVFAGLREAAGAAFKTYHLTAAAWGRYLASERDADALAAWRSDSFSGRV